MTRARIVVRKAACTLEFIEGARVETYPVAIGSNPDGADKATEGDCRTPEGVFTIVSVEDSSGWTRDGKFAYGPAFLRLDCPPWKGIGIHGTDEPGSVGTKASLGCVRMRNEDLARIVDRVTVGTTVEIVP